MPWDRSNVGFLSLFVCFCVYYPAGGKDDAVVKGPPSPPRYLSRSIVGVAENKYHFSWLASRNTGGLPVNYSVELCVTHVNIKMCKWSMKPECQPRNIRNNQQKFSCLLDGDFFPSYSRQAYDYTLHVWAENELGNASSALFSPVVPYRSVTPLPPLGIRAEALGSNEIYVHWQPRKDWYLIQLEYKLIFHPKDGVNKTKLVLGPQNYTRLTIEDGVEAFLTYYIYVMVRFINGKTKGHFSELHPPVVVKTKAGVPGSPPVVKKHHAQVFPENALLRNVTVEWERSKIAAWRGTPYLYKVECRRHQLLVCSSDVNATLNHTVLHRLNSTDYYNVYIRMCNKQEGCSGLGNSYTISAEDAGVGTESTRKRPNKEFLILILSSGALFVALIIGAGFLWRKQRYSRGAGSLSNLALDPPPPNDYNIVDPDIQHPYDRVDLI